VSLLFRFTSQRASNSWTKELRVEAMQPPLALFSTGWPRSLDRSVVCTHDCHEPFGTKAALSNAHLCSEARSKGSDARSKGSHCLPAACPAATACCPFSLPPSRPPPSLSPRRVRSSCIRPRCTVAKCMHTCDLFIYGSIQQFGKLTLPLSNFDK
jgi:hypothetical protein